MRRLAAAFVVTALVAPISAQQRASIRWEPTGGPRVAQQKQIIVQRGRLLLVGTGGQWWRSSDRGKSWKAFEEGTPRPWIVAADQRTLFGDAADGVVRSSDMGDSWTQCGAVPVNRRTGNEVTSIAADESRVYVSIFRVGLFRSDDQCATWMPLETPWKLDFPPSIPYANRSRVIVRALGGSFLSVDAGKTWTPLEPTLPGPLAFTSGCNEVILAGTGRGVFASRDDGRSWAPLGLKGRWVPAVAAPRCDEVFAVVQDSGLWTHSVFRSTDGGANWTTVNEGLSRHPITALASDEDGQTYAAGSSGAFQWSNDEWEQIGPADITITSVVVAPWGETFAAAGWMGLFASRTTSEPWRRLLIGHDAHVSPHSPPGGGGASVVFFTPKADILAATHGGGVLRSRDRGRTWRFVGLSRTVHSFVSTSNGALLAGTENGIFRSVDEGESWIERSIGLTAFRIYCLAVAMDGTVYAGTWEGQMFRSTDEGDRWRPMAEPRGGNPVHALVALKNGDVFAGSDAGLSRWSRSSQSWQPIPLPTRRGTSFVRALVQDNANVIFAGTEGDGVFASFDEGITWQAANDGLTVNRVFALGLDGHGHIVAGTSAGVFRGANVSAPKQVGGH
jgi:photosystem II stability/assembly factor-like uncharacterized protein